MPGKLKNTITRKTIRVRGLVQGVGFRPNVWRLARQAGVTGTVCNDGGGVLIDVTGKTESIDQFVEAIKSQSPPLSRIDALEVATEVPAKKPPSNFTIANSASGKVTTSIIPDAATCNACKDDITDPNNRRFRYPFTNCTDCGPRLSITREIPYDRANTSMAPFIMCKDCQGEYEDPADRRFHAQPNACPKCGPQVWLCDATGKTLVSEAGQDVISQTAELIKQGNIVAIKGIGGFHLACDATNSSAVRNLRARKKRYGKPLALMADSIDMIRRFALVSGPAIEALTSPAGPIVLLPKLQGAEDLADDIAPDQSTFGFMLPYTPLHHLLMSEVERPLVMTSGNVSNEPQVTENAAALDKLSSIADNWLMHDREIINRLDDSVVQQVAGKMTHLRRARGFAPESLVLPDGFGKAPDILAMGADLKNTFCMLKNGKAIVSQHIGDLQDAGVHEDFRKALDLYRKANDFSPARIAVDIHPGYWSTRWGERVGQTENIPMNQVQHHHAHIAACLAEHGFDADCDPVLGIVFDGLGFGEDNTLWGGEFLVANYKRANRVCHLEPVAIPGGEKASGEPWRNTFAHLDHAFGWPEVERRWPNLDLVYYLQKKPVNQLRHMIGKKLNAPTISSAGRLFDAVAGALGVFPDQTLFEGQAAMKLQSLAEGFPNETGIYDVSIGKTISWQPMWHGILEDLNLGAPAGRIARRFHNTLQSAICEATEKTVAEHGLNTVVLSGGVFQNRLLCELTFDGLRSQGLRVLYPDKYPANDGGISLGQAMIAAARFST